MIFADTHAHLYLEEFDQDRDDVIANALRNGVKYIFLPNIDSETVPGMVELALQYPGTCFPMIGLHPTSVKANYLDELHFIEKELSERGGTYYAIGEVGVDLYWSKEFENEQISAFSFQLNLAAKYDLPVVIHTRNSFEQAIAVIEKKGNLKLKGIFHCFGGNLAQANQAISLGFKLGIGGVLTYKNSGLQQVVEAIDLEHLVLETDAPFLPPVPHRGQRNSSAYIPIIAQKLAEIKGVDISMVAEITTRTAKSMFRVTSD